ncbi:MAG TPA: RDD family protein [Candidatus Acidoferrales bacterium]|nr:RDD family protein [Candidatus Acidoferrales bacterium]
MYCSKCGANVPENATFCSACGQPTGVATGAPTAGVPVGGYSPVAAPSIAMAAPTTKYAGFWLRFVAFIIDVIILGFIGFVVTLPFLGSLPFGAMMHGRPMSPEELAPFVGGLGRLALLRIVVNWLYYALFESSAWQATIGKKALGLTVTDLEGRRIGFGRATGRFFAKILSFMILCIGFFMIAFTSKKQGLHDILAGTLVLREM